MDQPKPQDGDVQVENWRIVLKPADQWDEPEIVMPQWEVASISGEMYGLARTPPGTVRTTSSIQRGDSNNPRRFQSRSGGWYFLKDEPLAGFAAALKKKFGFVLNVEAPFSNALRAPQAAEGDPTETTVVPLRGRAGVMAALLEEIAGEGGTDGQPARTAVVLPSSRRTVSRSEKKKRPEPSYPAGQLVPAWRVRQARKVIAAAQGGTGCGATGESVALSPLSLFLFLQRYL